MSEFSNFEEDLMKLADSGQIKPETADKIKDFVTKKASLSEPKNITEQVKAERGEPLLTKIAKGAYSAITDPKSDPAYIEPDVAYNSIEVNNPKTGKNEIFKDISKSQFNDFMKKGYQLVNFEKSGEKNKLISPIQQNKPAEVPQQEQVQAPIQEPVEQPQDVSAQQVSPQPIQQSVQPGLPAQSKQVDPFAQQIEAAKQLADAQMQENKKKGELYDERAVIEQEKAKQKADLAKQLALETENKYKKIQSDIDKYQNTSIKEPSIWADKSIGSKLMVGLGLFLGAAPNSTGQNTAVAVLEKVLNRNLEVQKANLEKMERGINFQRSSLTDLYNTYKDKDLAIDAFNSIQLGNVENQLKKMAEISSNEKVKANLLNAQGLIGEQKKELDLKVRKQLNDEYNSRTNRMNVLLDYQTKANAPKANPFQSKVLEKSAEDYQKDINNLPNIDSRLENTKQAWKLLDKVATGPVVGSDIIAALRKPGNPELQTLANSFSKEGMETVKQFAKDAGARSVDSDAEKKFLFQTIPGIDKHKETNQNILLASTAIAKREKLNTILKQAYVKKYGNLDGFELNNPLVNLKSYYNPKSGDVEFFQPGKPKEGFLDLAQRLEGGKLPGSKTEEGEQSAIPPVKTFK